MLPQPGFPVIGHYETASFTQFWVCRTKKGLSTETSQCAHPISLMFGLQPVSLYVVNEQLNIVGLTEPRNT